MKCLHHAAVEYAWALRHGDIEDGDRAWVDLEHAASVYKREKHVGPLKCASCVGDAERRAMAAASRGTQP